ncbi:MAG: sigma-70 family RNA polymerase sigma factor [Saprospiraceae bacterium]|nr:sigma-70 family RNA polymerase sigma factor [Saprospiraceae bacterium]
MGNFNKQDNKLEKLFAMYERPMYYYALKITEDPHMAEDVVQDAFCKMIKYIEAIRYEDDREIKSYLLTVIKTCAADLLRKNKNKETVTDSLEDNVIYVFPYNVGGTTQNFNNDSVFTY